MLDRRRRRWAYVVQMVYKCFVFAGKQCPHQQIPSPGNLSGSHSQQTRDVGPMLL